MPIDIEKITDANVIMRIQNYVIALGKILYVFDTSGKLLFRRKDIVHCRKVAYISDNKLLVDVCGNKYYLISLLDGKNIWCVHQTARDISSERFACTPLFDFAFDYYSKRGRYYLVRIDLKNGQTLEKHIQQTLRVTRDIMCDSKGVPCLLQMHYSESAQERTSENAVVKAIFLPSGNDVLYQIDKQWTHNSNMAARSFFSNTEQILTNNLNIYCPSTGQSWDLLKNEPSWNPQGKLPLLHFLYLDELYLILMFVSANVVISLEQQKVIAKYSAQYKCGCVFGDEFWICTENGLQRKPFPSIEDVQHFKINIWKP